MDPRLSALRLPALTLPLLLSAACPAPPQHLGDFTTDSDADDSSATSAATDNSSADPSADPSAGEQPGALDGVEVSFVQIDARYPGADQAMPAVGATVAEMVIRFAGGRSEPRSSSQALTPRA